MNRQWLVGLVGLVLLVMGAWWLGMGSDEVKAQSGGTTTRVSVTSDGIEGNGWSEEPVISADGRYVAFISQSTNLAISDTNRLEDVFVHERATGQTFLVSTTSERIPGNSLSANASISADGRYIAFASGASNLVSNDVNNAVDIFVYDQEATATKVSLVSVASDGSQANGGGGNLPSISGDGRYVTFYSGSTNLVSNDTNNTNDIFVRDRETGSTKRVSVSSDGTEADGRSFYSFISPNGRFIVFESFATNLVVSDTNVSCNYQGWLANCQDIFFHDQQTGETELISLSSDESQGNGTSSSPAISADGRYVAFNSESSNLVSNDTNGRVDVFVRDRVTGDTERVSIDSFGQQADRDSILRGISPDGLEVVFTTADNLDPDIICCYNNIYIHHRDTGITERVSLSDLGEEPNGDSHNGAISKQVISADGRYVVFGSTASNLVANDTNANSDIFIRDRGGLSPVASVTDLSAATGLNAGQINLTWVAPEGITPNMSYHIRHAGTAIETELGWEMATPFTNTLTPSSPGTSESIAINSLTPGQTYYFALRVEDETGRILALSNSPSAVAQAAPGAGFHPTQNGYQFKNIGGIASWQTFSDTFGIANVEWPDGRRRSIAEKYFYRTFEQFSMDGACSGMAASSALLYKEWAQPSNFLESQGARYAYQVITPTIQNDSWRPGPVADFIVRYQTYEEGLGIKDARAVNVQSVNGVLADITDGIDAGLTNPYLIGIWGALEDGSCAAHALVPYRYERFEAQTYVYVYDPNNPYNPRDPTTATTRRITFRPTENRWSYPMWRSLSWGSGQSTSCSNAIQALPLSLWLDRPIPPWPLSTGATRNISNTQIPHDVLIEGNAHLLLTDNQGRSSGYRNGQFVNEIPGAFQVIPIGASPDIIPDYPERYQLEPTTSFTTTVTYTSTGPSTVSQLAPQGIIEVAGNVTQGAGTDTIHVSPDARDVTLQAGVAGNERGITLLQADPLWEREVSASGFALADGEEATLTFGPSTATQQDISFASDSDIPYQMKALQATATDTLEFLTSDLSLAAGDTHTLKVDWTNVSTATLEIDHDSDGTVDETRVIPNENGAGGSLLYLPVLRR